MPVTRAMALEQKVDGIISKLEAFEKRMDEKLERMDAKWRQSDESLRKETSENSQHIRVVESQVKDLKSTVTGFQNSLGGIHGNVRKLEQQLESHLSQCPHNIVGSSSIVHNGPGHVGTTSTPPQGTNPTSGRPRNESYNVPDDFEDDGYYHEIGRAHV